MEFARQFFSTLPEAFAGLWEFIDGLYGITLLVGSLALIAVLVVLALRVRPRHEWMAAILGVLGGFVAFWWLFGMLPSAWVYFVDGERELMEGAVLPGALPGADNFYQVFRDLVIVGETGVATLGFVVLAFALQKRFPRGLAEDEEKQPSSGGYK